MSTSRYSGPGYDGRGGPSKINRIPTYNTQLSSDGGGYSSTGSGYQKGYKNYSGSYAPTTTKYIGSGSSDRYNLHERPSSAASQPYKNDYGRQNYSTATGYTSDYGRSGYNSSGYKSDYGKSGYGSDYGQSGYASGTGYGSDYGCSGYGSGNGYKSDYRMPRYGSGASSSYEPSSIKGRSNYSTYRRPNTKEKSPDRLTKRSTYGPSAAAFSYSRSSSREDPPPSRTGRESYSRSISRESGSGSSTAPYLRNTYSSHPSTYVRRDTGGTSTYRGTYSRSVSRDEPPPPATTITQSSLRNTNKINRSGSEAVSSIVTTTQSNKTENRKSKECKAPADFTSDSSSSENESGNEDMVYTYVISRATSPTQKPPPPGDFSKCISATIKTRRSKQNNKTPKLQAKESNSQTTADDFQLLKQQKQQQQQQQQTQANDGTKPRYPQSGGITKPSAGYYDRYYGKYTNPFVASNTKSSRTYGISNSSSKGDITKKINTSSTSRQNSQEDKKNSSVPCSPTSPHEGKIKEPFKPIQNVAQNATSKIPLKQNQTQQLSNDVENKEFRKSVLNMNIKSPEIEQRQRHEQSPRHGPPSPVAPDRKSQPISKCHSRNMLDPSTAEKQTSRDDSDSDSESSSEEEPPKIYHTPSQTKVNSEKEDDRIKSQSRRKSHEGQISPNHKSSSTKGSKEDINTDHRQRSCRDYGADERPRSRRGSKDETSNHLRRNRSREETEDDDDAHSVRSNVSSSQRRRRNGSNENILENNEPDRKTSHVRRRQGSLEGILDELPPRPSRHSSRESILDDRPRRRNQQSYGEDNINSRRSPVSPYSSQHHEDSSSRNIRKSGSREMELRLSHSTSRSHSQENILDEKSRAVSPRIRTPPHLPHGNNNLPVISVNNVHQKQNHQPAKSHEESSSEEEDSSEDEEVEEINSKPKAQVRMRPIEATSREISSYNQHRRTRPTSLLLSNSKNDYGSRPASSRDSQPSSGTTEDGGRFLNVDKTFDNNRRASTGDIKSNYARTPKKPKEKFIGTFKDIDNFLNGDDDKDGTDDTFEDFEKKFNDKSVITASLTLPRNKPSQSNQKEVAKQTLGLFIGKCRDIDDVLGTVGPGVVAGGDLFHGHDNVDCGTSANAISSSKPIRPTMLAIKKDVQRFDEERASAVAAAAIGTTKPSVKPGESTEEDESDDDEDEDEDEEDDDEDEEEGTSSSAVEEVDAKAVKVHDSKAQQPKFETYTEEIDSSAVRIRESKALAPQLHTYTEEIDSSGVRIREPNLIKGRITNVPTPKRQTV